MVTRHPRTLPEEPKDASEFTVQANSDFKEGLNFHDKTDAHDARKGHLLTWEPFIEIHQDNDPTKRVVWTMEHYQDQEIGASCPDTVNPSLWRQATLNQTNGLFEVTEGIYQVRAFDMSNMTIIEAPRGLIIIDPLISCECAADALKLYRTWCAQHKRPHLEIAAVIFTHSHVDHFGGVLGVITPGDIKNGIQIVAPDGFMEHAVSENVYAGVAMSRRAQYMYGPYLKQNARGQVDGGLGKGQSVGRVSIAKPNLTISKSGVFKDIAGLDIDFHMTPGAEAPSEFDFYFEKFNAFCAAENAVHTMHNIQTLRGAKVRDALLWSKYMNETLQTRGGKVGTLFASHHWPIWGADRITSFLTTQRDMYRYLNDQTLRMLNKGYTGIEIAEVFEMPPALAREWSCRGYYGSVNHNVKAVYDRYMGWFDGNPSNLHPHPPEVSSQKFVKAFGARKILRVAADAHAQGDYRWAAELLNKLIFAEPDNKDAKLLQADVLEQLGYQAEAATWRNFYLMGAQELRDGPPEPEMTSADPSMAAQMTEEMIFDALAAHINGPLANDDTQPLVMNWNFVEEEGRPAVNYLVELSNGALSTTAAKQSESPDVTVTLTRTILDELIAQQISPLEALKQGLRIHGTVENVKRFKHLFELIDPGVVDFPIVTPRPGAYLVWRGVAPPKPHTAPRPIEPALQRKVRVLGKLPRGC